MFIIVSVISDDVPFLLWLQGMPSMGEMAFCSVGWWWWYRRRGLALSSEDNISDYQMLNPSDSGQWLPSEWRCLPWTEAPTVVVIAALY